MNNHFHAGTKAGTVGGTLTTIIANLDAGDVVRTCILATVGALVSFTVSVILKWLVKSLKKKIPG